MYEGKLVRLRELRLEEVPLFIGWLNELETVRQIANFRLPLTIEQERNWLKTATDADDACHFAVETLDGTLIGSCCCMELNWQSRTCKVGWVIGNPEARGKGYGTDLIQTLLRVCFQELNLHKVSLGVFEHNERAVRLYERLGFVREGVLREQRYTPGKRWDEYIYGMSAANGRITKYEKIS